MSFLGLLILGLSPREQFRRREVEAFCRTGDVIGADDASEIRTTALAAFVKELDGKLANLQIGEKLAVRFSVDIVTQAGKVRAGSGASRNMPEYVAWRKAVYERDGYTCQDCGARRRLNAHHVKPWQGHPALRFEVSNGRTVCDDCHAAYHPHLRLIRAEKGRKRSSA